MADLFSLRNKKIWVAGHNGLVGASLVRRLQREDAMILTIDKAGLDLRRQADVEAWIDANKPDAIILAAAKVGGIRANSDYPADFLYDNLAIETNIIHAAYRAKVGKLLFLGSSCIYPRQSAQPIAESALLTGALEPTNEWYAVAKIAGLKLCQAYRRQHGCDFITAMPCNLYGPGDTYDAAASHVIPALILKMHAAKERNLAQVTLWGSGTPLREFLFVDDLADALVFLLARYSSDVPVNIGSGDEVTISDLAIQVAAVIGYTGAIAFDPAHPDGVARKLLDTSRLRALGWAPETALADGLKQAYAAYLEQAGHARAA